MLKALRWWQQWSLPCMVHYYLCFTVLPLCCPYSTDLETFLRPAFVHSHLQWLFQLNWEPEQVRLKQGSYSPLHALGTGTTDKKMEQTVETGIF